jgi:RHS repeat-associated protein
LTNEAGGIGWTANYKAWGQAKIEIREAAQKVGIKNPIRFQGQYFDEETGLHYNRFRYYDPDAGRFISKDPIGLLGAINTYEYVDGNPVSYTDPQGLQPVPRGMYLPRGPAISGPPGLAENTGNGTARTVMNQFTNLPNDTETLPNGWVGVNTPWSMPKLVKVCDGPYTIIDPNSGGMCKAAALNPQGPFLSSPGQAPARSCSSFHFVQAARVKRVVASVKLLKAGYRCSSGVR